MIKCKICGYETEKLLSGHLKRVHHINSKEYLALYPDSEVSSQEWKNMMSERNRSDNMRRITSERNKTDSMRKIVSERNKNPEFIKKCKDGLRNPDVRKHRSEIASKRNHIMWQSQEYRSKMHKVLSASQKKNMNKDESINRQREIMIRNWSNKNLARKMLDAPRKSIFGVHGIHNSIKFDKEFKFKSLGELEFIKLMESLDSVHSLDYETIRLKMSDGRTYIPDFLVNNHYLVEVKFDDSYTEFPDKVDAAIKYCNSNNLEFCWVRRFKEMKFIAESRSLKCAVLCRSKIG
jgi:hypothetical protein